MRWPVELFDLLNLFAFQHPLLYGLAWAVMGALAGGALVATWLDK